MSDGTYQVKAYVLPHDKTDFEMSVPDGAWPIGVQTREIEHSWTGGESHRYPHPTPNPACSVAIMLVEPIGGSHSLQRWFIVNTNEPFKMPPVYRHLGSFNNGDRHVFHEIRR